MSLFEDEGKTTVEEDTWGLKTGKLGGEYRQNRDREGRGNGYILTEIDELGLRTGVIGGEYHRHYNEYDEYVGYSFDQDGKTIYVDVTYDDDDAGSSGQEASHPSSFGGEEGDTTSYGGGSYSGGGYSNGMYAHVAGKVIKKSGFGKTMLMAAVIIAVLTLVSADPKSLTEEEERQNHRKHLWSRFLIATLITIVIAFLFVVSVKEIQNEKLEGQVYGDTLGLAPQIVDSQNSDTINQIQVNENKKERAVHIINIPGSEGGFYRYYTDE